MAWSFKSSCLILISLLMVFGDAEMSMACTPYDVVLDSYGSIVKDSYGCCIRTKWEAEEELCGKVKTQQPALRSESSMDEWTVYFDFNKAGLKSSEQEKIKKLVKKLKENKVQKIRVTGYTDSIGSEDYNKILSENRAQAVNQYINTLLDLQSSIIEIKGYGKSNQVKACPTAKEKEALIMCLAPNRRVQVAIDYTN